MMRKAGGTFCDTYFCFVLGGGTRLNTKMLTSLLQEQAEHAQLAAWNLLGGDRPLFGWMKAVENIGYVLQQQPQLSL